MLAASLIFVAVVTSSPDPCAGTDHFGEVTFTVSDGATVFLQVFGEAEPSHACMRLGECEWVWTVSPGQAEELNGLISTAAGPAASDCAAESTRQHDKPPYQGIRRVACGAAAERVKSLLFVRQFVESLGAVQCVNEAVDASDARGIRLTGELTIVGETLCVSTRWLPSSAAASVWIGHFCPSPSSASLAPEQVLVTAAQDGAARVSWQLRAVADAWEVLGSTGTSTGNAAYTQAWSAAVGSLLPVRVRLPDEDALGGDRDTAIAAAPWLLGRWAAAFAAPTDSYLDTLLRVWMARVKLLNPSTAQRALYRRECATTTRPLLSCSP